MTNRDCTEPNPGDYLLLLLFTGLRREEAAQLSWEDVDFAGRLIRLPAASTKARRKLDLPMTDFVCDLLVARRAVGQAEFVFPGDASAATSREPKFPLGLVAKATGINVSRARSETHLCHRAESTDICPHSRRLSTTASARTYRRLRHDDG